MPDTTYLIAAVLLAASITFALRALPLAERGGADRRGDHGGGRHGRRPALVALDAVVNLF